jgi:hypothetical protein
MADLVFLVPRSDYMQDEKYDLLDSILTSAGFSDNGLMTGEYSFRCYGMSEDDFRRIPFLDLPNLSSDGFFTGKVLFYADNSNPDVVEKMASYGVSFAGSTGRGGFGNLDVFCLYLHNFPLLAKMCEKVLASPRLIKETAYFKWIDRGAKRDDDWTDWLCAENETQERIDRLLRQFGP